MNVNTPIYQQLADLLRERILSGDYIFGDALPSERLLAEKYEINHLTVRKALGVLADEGLVLRVHGKGTFVNKPRVSMNMKNIEGFASFLEKKGVKVINKVLYTGLREARYKYSKIFGIGEDEPVFTCTRLRFGDGIPMAVEYNAVPLKYAPDLCQYDFKVFSLHNVYAKNNIRIVSEHQTLEIVKASNPQARLLNLEEGDGVFLLTSYAVDDRNRIVEYTRIYNSDDRIVFYASADEAGKL